MAPRSDTFTWRKQPAVDCWNYIIKDSSWGSGLARGGEGANICFMRVTRGWLPDSLPRLCLVKDWIIFFYMDDKINLIGSGREEMSQVWKGSDKHQFVARILDRQRYLNAWTNLLRRPASLDATTSRVSSSSVHCRSLLPIRLCNARRTSVKRNPLGTCQEPHQERDMLCLEIRDGYNTKPMLGFQTYIIGRCFARKKHGKWNPWEICSNQALVG